LLKTSLVQSKRSDYQSCLLREHLSQVIIFKITIQIKNTLFYTLTAGLHRLFWQYLNRTVVVC